MYSTTEWMEGRQGWPNPADRERLRAIIGELQREITAAGVTPPAEKRAKKVWHAENRMRYGLMKEMQRRINVRDSIYNNATDRRQKQLKQEYHRIQRWDADHARTLHQLERLRQLQRALPAVRALSQPLIIDFGPVPGPFTRRTRWPRRAREPTSRNDLDELDDLCSRLGVAFVDDWSSDFCRQADQPGNGPHDSSDDEPGGGAGALDALKF